MNLIAIVGEPGSGKSSVMRDVMRLYVPLFQKRVSSFTDDDIRWLMPEIKSETAVKFARGRLPNVEAWGDGFRAYAMRYHMLGGLAILGDYRKPDETFPGTDRLSMGAQPWALKLLEQWKQHDSPPKTVLFEGDRFTNGFFFRSAVALFDSVEIIFLTTEPEVAEARRLRRVKQPSPTWVKARQTKIQNIFAADFGPTVLKRSFPSNTEMDRAKIVHYVMRRIEEQCFPPYTLSQSSLCLSTFPLSTVPDLATG